MTHTPAITPMAHPPKSWYREPYIWLVVGGPLVVVLASIVTVYLAVSHPDPVLNRNAPSPAVAADSGKLSAEELDAIERSTLPAGVARNHAASPTLPADR